MPNPIECPRQRFEAVLAVQFEHKAHETEDGCCSYCGSLTPDRFFAAIDAGAEIGPTDKAYKVYVTVPNPKAGEMRVISGSNSAEAPASNWEPADPAVMRASGWTSDYRWMLRGPEGPNKTMKFYFQHLDEAGQRRFVDLMNAGALKLGYPGRFYATPFFMRMVPKAGAV